MSELSRREAVKTATIGLAGAAAATAAVSSSANAATCSDGSESREYARHVVRSFPADGYNTKELLSLVESVNEREAIWHDIFIRGIFPDPLTFKAKFTVPHSKAGEVLGLAASVKTLADSKVCCIKGFPYGIVGPFDFMTELETVSKQQF